MSKNRRRGRILSTCVGNGDTWLEHSVEAGKETPAEWARKVHDGTFDHSKCRVMVPGRSWIAGFRGGHTDIYLVLGKKEEQKWRKTLGQKE